MKIKDNIIYINSKLSDFELNKINDFADSNNSYAFIYSINLLLKHKLIKDSQCEIELLIFNDFIIKFRSFFNPIMVFEYNLIKDELTFIDFLKISNSTTWIRYFLRKYPLIIDKILISIKNISPIIDNFKSRLVNDKAEIKKKFQISNFKIVSIECFKGDFHNGWKATTKIIFAENRIIFYKHRHSRNELFLNNLSLFFKKTGFKYKSYGIIKLICKNDYTWMREVKFKKCKNVTEVSDFFFNQGINTALFYFLKGSDLIGDNIIVSNKLPYFYDLEALIIPETYENLEKDLYEYSSLSNHFIKNSVLATGLIPYYSFESYNFQGVSNAGLSLSNKEIPIKDIIYENNEFKLKEIGILLNADNNHLPTLSNKKIEIDKYINFYLKGFNVMFKHVIKNKEKLIEFVLKSKFSKNRIIYRNSSVYGTLINESFLPKYQNSKTLRNKLFSNLKISEDLVIKKNSEIINSEIRQIKELDLPYFFSYIDSKHLYNDSNHIISKDFFIKTGIDNIVSSINQASLVELKRQKEIIKLSFAIHNNIKIKKATIKLIMLKKLNENIIFDKSFLIVEALNIEKKINSKSFVDIKGIPSYWGLTQSIKSTFKIQAKSWGIFDGVDGIAFFYLNLYLVTNEEKYKDIGVNFIKIGISQFSKFKAFYEKDLSFNKISILNYPISTFYIYELFFDVIKDDFLISESTLLLLLNWIEIFFVEENDYDLLSGSAGTIIYLHKLYDRVKNRKIITLISKLGLHIVAGSIRKDNHVFWISKYGKAFTGFSHGNSGIAYSLFLCYDLTKNIIFNQYAILALNFERDVMFDKKENYWYYFLKVEKNEIDKYKNHNWAYGSGGILLSRILISKFYKDDIIDSEIEIAKNNIFNYGLVQNHNYSSGIFGNIDVLNELSMFDKKKLYIDIIKQSLIETVKNKKENYQWKCAPVGKNNSNIELDGLFSGIAGIANVMLNLVAHSKTKKLFFPIIVLILMYNYSLAQNRIKVAVVGSVDTNNIEINKVFNLFENYINNKPDSVKNYSNPYWEKSEIDYNLNNGLDYFDDASHFIYRGGYKANSLYKVFKPKVLDIEKLDSNLFTIKTLLYSNKYEQDSNYSKWNPQYIIKYYCIKNGDNYYLKNAINYETNFWNEYVFECIHYKVHPSVFFDTLVAKKSYNFLEKVSAQYSLDLPKKISYYIAPNRATIANLYNFDYVVSYFGAITNTFLSRIIGRKEDVYNNHELTHILFHQQKWKDNTRPFIIAEGIATFLGGVDGRKTFKEDLKVFSKEISSNKSITFDDIVNRIYHHTKDNIPQYVLGGYMFYKVFKIYKEDGVIQLFNCGAEDKDFNTTVEKLFKIPITTFKLWIIDELKKEYKN